MGESDDPQNSDDNPMQGPDQNSDQPKPPTLLQIAFSVVAAAFGVQTNKNRQRDFAGGNPVVFIVTGLIFTVLFVLSIIGVVTLVLA